MPADDPRKAHELLLDHRTNLNDVQRALVDRVVAEHDDLLIHAAHLQEENVSLLRDVARLTHRLLNQSEDLVAARRKVLDLEEAAGPVPEDTGPGKLQLKRARKTKKW